jgi:hypothetical protein
MAAKSARPVAPSTPAVPGSETPALAEPTTPRTPPPPKPDQRAPASVSPTGNDAGNPVAFNSHSGVYLTTAQGVPLAETEDSLRRDVPRGRREWLLPRVVRPRSGPSSTCWPRTARGSGSR